MGQEFRLEPGVLTDAAGVLLADADLAAQAGTIAVSLVGPVSALPAAGSGVSGAVAAFGDAWAAALQQMVGALAGLADRLEQTAVVAQTVESDLAYALGGLGR